MSVRVPYLDRLCPHWYDPSEIGVFMTNINSISAQQIFAAWDVCGHSKIKNAQWPSGYHAKELSAPMGVEAADDMIGASIHGH